MIDEYDYDAYDESPRSFLAWCVVGLIVFFSIVVAMA